MKLTCFHIRNHALDSDKLPERIKILSWGENPSIKGLNPKVTPRTFSVLPGVQTRSGCDQVPLDYEHNTVEGSRAWKESAEPRKVAAYGAAEVVENDGLYLSGLTYTPNGRENAPNYIDLSPAVLMDEKTGEVLGLHSCALTRNGAIAGIHFFNIGGAVAGDEPQQGDDEMTLEELGKQVTALAGDLAAMRTRLDTFSAAKPETVTALETRLGAIETSVKTFSAALEQRDKDAILAGAAADGKEIKIKPELLAKFSVEELRDHVAGIKPTVPLQRRTPRTTPPDGEGATVMEQYNAIEDPAARAAFYQANRAKLAVV